MLAKTVAFAVKYLNSVININVRSILLQYLHFIGCFSNKSLIVFWGKNVVTCCVYEKNCILDLLFYQILYCRISVCVAFISLSLSVFVSYNRYLLLVCSPNFVQIFQRLREVAIGYFFSCGFPKIL